MYNQMEQVKITEEGMGIFSIFRKSKKEAPADVTRKINVAIARAEGKLPPPNLGISFQCECGQRLSSNLNNFNLIGGTEVMCAYCGAVTFLPPEILDHTPTASKTATLKTATLKTDWKQLIRIVRHGK